jgi:N,N-dimethylformamidase
MYEIDPERLDLAREFKANPLGRHSAALQAVVTRMRALPIEGKHCLIVTKPREQWVLAQMNGAPLRPEVVPDFVFTSLADAEWTIFKLRWKVLTGHDLDEELNEPPRPPAPEVILPDPSRAILAYPDRLSVAPGERIKFHVSCHDVAEYQADIVQLHSPATGPRDAGFRQSEVEGLGGSIVGRTHRLRIGSKIRDLDSVPLPNQFTMQILAWPTRLAARKQVLFGSLGNASGIEVYLDEAGAFAVSLSSGTLSTNIPLQERTWYRLAISYDGAHLRMLQEPIAVHGFSKATAVTRETAIQPPRVQRAPWLIAAADDAHHFNGKLEAPCVIGQAVDLHTLPLAAGDLAQRADVIALWDFSQSISTDDIVDLGPHGFDCSIDNQPTRAVTGHNWDGTNMDWRAAPHQYGAIHFHDDDIDFAAWPADFNVTIPAGLKSGVYAARLRGGGCETYVPFFVRPTKATAKVAFLAPTATYTVYCNNKARFFLPVTELIRGRVLDFDAADLQLLHYPLGLSTYCTHSDGSGVCYGSRMRPVTNFRPKGRLWNFSGDLQLIAWMDQTGVPYDVITDDDLHRDGAALLKEYEVVVTGTHPEYYTLEMLDALESHQRDGGRLMYMGGNGFYWRIAYRPGEPGIIETRRGEGGTRSWESDPGEYHMAFDGALGGLWRRQGRPPNLLTGIGFAAQGFDTSTHYRRTAQSHDPRVRFMFEGIADDVLGNFGPAGGAAGEEIDAFDLAQGSPRHGLVVASSENHSPTYQPAGDTIQIPNIAIGASHNPAIRADMVFFECPGGGAVFSTGSIAYAGALAHNGYDNNIARLTGNVLRRFANPTPFKMPE